MIDFLGYKLESPAPVLQPRAGGWYLLTINTEDNFRELVRAGAHTTRDGKRIVAIFSSPVSGGMVDATATGADGRPLPPAFVTIPAHYNPVRSDGRTITVFDANDRPRDLIIYQDNPVISKVEPLTDLADFPPGRVRDPNWTPSA